MLHQTLLEEEDCKLKEYLWAVLAGERLECPDVRDYAIEQSCRLGRIGTVEADCAQGQLHLSEASDGSP